jgi:hypothetical protein
MSAPLAARDELGPAVSRTSLARLVPAYNGTGFADQSFDSLRHRESEAFSEPEVRPMREADIAAGIGLCRLAGWNQGEPRLVYGIAGPELD